MDRVSRLEELIREAGAVVDPANGAAGSPAEFVEGLRVHLRIERNKLPVVHLLKDDGAKIATFRDKIVAIPEPSEDADERSSAVFAVLIDGNGRPYTQRNGDWVVLEAMPLWLLGMWPDDKLLAVDMVTKLTGLRESTIEREIEAGRFPKPRYPSTRRKAWQWGGVKQWLEALPEDMLQNLRERRVAKQGA